MHSSLPCHYCIEASKGVEKGGFRQDIRTFSTVRVLRQWDRLPWEAEDAHPLPRKFFQGKAGQGFEQPGLVEVVSAHAEGLNYMISEWPLQPKTSYDSGFMYFRAVINRISWFSYQFSLDLWDYSGMFTPTFSIYNTQIILKDCHSKHDGLIIKRLVSHFSLNLYS